MIYFTHDKPLDENIHSNFSEVPALHPVFKRFKNRMFVSEHHMLEDLEAEWFEEELYIKPLEEYLLNEFEFNSLVK